MHLERDSLCTWCGVYHFHLPQGNTPQADADNTVSADLPAPPNPIPGSLLHFELEKHAHFTNSAHVEGVQDIIVCWWQLNLVLDT